MNIPTNAEIESAEEYGFTAPDKRKVCREEPMRLMVDGNKYATFMCTPEDLEDMARGHLLTGGVIGSIEEILDIDVEYTPVTVSVETSKPEITSRYKIKDVLSSSCGDGTNVSREFIESVHAVVSDRQVSNMELIAYMREMFSQAYRNQETGGVHSAALFDSQGTVVVREDVGRHNAVDKVIGAAAQTGVVLADCVLITTGRIAGDMMLKALSVGIPIVGSRSIPSTFALEIAEKTGITVVGRISKNAVVYCGEQRFTG